ncbi:unnamed protein product, partial [Discosporangium mesarthrocarpum]
GGEGKGVGSDAEDKQGRGRPGGAGDGSGLGVSRPGLGHTRETWRGEDMEVRTIEGGGSGKEATGRGGEEGNTKAMSRTSGAADKDGSRGWSGDKGDRAHTDEAGEELLRVVALFEFLRFGDPGLLPTDLSTQWDARPDLGLGLMPALAFGQARARATSVMGGSGQRPHTMGGGTGRMTEPNLREEGSGAMSRTDQQQLRQ